MATTKRKNSITKSVGIFSKKKPNRTVKITAVVVAVSAVVVGAIAYFSSQAPESYAAGCVSNTYKQSSSSNCVKYLEQMVNGVTQVYSGQKYDFSKEALNADAVKVDKYYSSKTKSKIVNFQRWGYKLSDNGTVGAKTWAELCGFVKTIILTTPLSADPAASDSQKSQDARIVTLTSAYDSASCASAHKSDNPKIIYGFSEPTPPPSTNLPPTTPPQTPLPVPVVGTSVNLKLASWSLQGGGGSADNSKENILNGLKSVLTSAQIVGTQEFHSNTKRQYIRDNLLCTSCAYSGYIQNYDYDGSSAGSLSILWNKSSLSLVDKGYQKVSDKITGINDSTGTNMSISSKWITWVKLKEANTGKNFYVLNTNTVASVEAVGSSNGNTARLANYTQHMNVLTGMIKKFQAENIPIFITGDFNVNYRYDSLQKYPDFPYARLGALAVRSGWDYLQLKDIDSSQATLGTGSRIADYVFSWNHPSVTYSSLAISSNRFGSDRSPIYLGLTLAK